MTVWLLEHVTSAHLIHVRRFHAFFAGRCSAKESATRFLANLSTVSRVVTVDALDISELEVEIEGCDFADRVDKDSEWVVIFAW